MEEGFEIIKIINVDKNKDECDTYLDTELFSDIRYCEETSTTPIYPTKHESEKNCNKPEQHGSSDGNSQSNTTVKQDKAQQSCERQHYARRRPYQRHSDKLKWVCEICGAVFDWKKEYKQHLMVQHKGELRVQHNRLLEEKFQCKYCPVKVPFKTQLKWHISSHKLRELDRIQCLKCDFTCFSVNVLQRHVQKVHTKHIFEGSSIKTEDPIKKKTKKPEVPLKSWFKCSLCLLSFDLKSEVYIHEKFHLPDVVHWKASLKKLDPGTSSQSAYKF